MPYLLIGAAVLVLFIGAGIYYYLRVYRDPVVLGTERDATAIMHIQLADIPAADKALDRAQKLSSTLTLNVISSAQWQRAKRAAMSPEGAIVGFCEALGARMGEAVAQTPTSAPAFDVTLPALTLRFARETAVCAVTGPALQHGDAVGLATALHRDGKGPREVVALDLSAQKNARKVLENVPYGAFVVLSSDELRDLLLSATPDREFEQALIAQRKLADLSPYQTQGAVKHEGLFFGRERELRLMADRELASFLLVGARQMGKSTLLQALARRLHARDDVEAHYVELASDDLLAHLEHERGIRANTAETADPYERLAACAVGSQARPHVWLLDEVDDFIRRDACDGYALTRAMRKLSSERRAYFVLAGYWDLFAAKFLEPVHPLRNLGELIELGPLDRDAAQALASQPMRALGISWQKEALERIINGVGRRANLIVLSCKALIESLPADQHEIMLDHVEDVLRGAPEIRERTHAYKALRDELRPPRRAPYTDLDQAIMYQALLMEQSTERPSVRAVRDALRQALQAHRSVFSNAEFEDALARLELGYLIVKIDNQMLTCPVPLMREQLERQGLEHLLQDCLDELAR
jgi:hypothetical protein